MRFESIKLRQMATFTGEVEVDFTRIPGQLIAITGNNGEGKSTLLELMPGALFRACATRGSLQDNARARDSFVEVTVCNGRRYKVRQLLDAVSGKGEASILDDAGRPVLASAKVRDADAWVAAHFPPASVLYASSIAVQERRGMLDLKESERKAVVLRALGIEHYERLAEQARERAREAKAALAALTARLSDLAKPDMQALEDAAAGARQRVEHAAEAVRGARVALDRAKAAAGDAARLAELAEQRRAAERRLAAAQKAVADIEERLANNRALLERAAEVRAAVALAADLDAQIVAARVAAGEAVQRFNAARAAEDAARQGHIQALDAVNQAQGRVLRAQGRLKDRARVAEAAARVESGLARVAELEGEIAECEQAATELERLVLSGKDQRIDGLRDGLKQVVADRGRHEARIARGTLDADDELNARAHAAPKLLEAARQQVRDRRALLTSVRRLLSEQQALAARAGEMAQAEADLAQAQQDETAASERLQTAKQARDDAERARAEANKAAEMAEDALTSLRGKRAALDSLLALREHLEKATTRIEEREAQLPGARAAVAQAEAELATLPHVDAATPVDLAGHEQELARQEGAERTARDERARDEAAVERARETLAARENLEQHVREAEDELADWTRLASDLGKDGLQAMEIDACLPEINAITNELLHTCHSTRYTVELRTDRLSADGKRSLEGLPIRVVDTEPGHGRECDVELLSPGQRSLIGEALSLALTTLSCRRAGTERPTLIRDESGAAIDAESSPAYVAMLRRAAQQIGADKILLVSHSPHVVELADARVRIANGRVEVLP